MMRLRSSTKPSVEGTIAGWNAAAADLSLFQMMAIAAEIGCPLPASLRDYLHNKTQILPTKKKALYMWLANSAAGLFLTAGTKELKDYVNCEFTDLKATNIRALKW